MAAFLVHGTVIAVGTTGILLTGPSGAGKTSMALRLVAGARRSGHFAAFVSDDQVLVEPAGERLVATAPAAIKGMVELRGSGIGTVEALDSVLLDFALMPVTVDAHNRIPEENQRLRLGDHAGLPLFFIDRAASEPFSLMAALVAGFPIAGTFQI